jgi:hypothetical protein
VSPSLSQQEGTCPLSEIRATTISDETGNGPIALTKQSAAKMWCQWDNTGTFTPKETFNTSSLTDTATGRTTISIASNMSSADYCSQAQSSEPGASGTLYVGNINTQTASSIEMRGRQHSGSTTTGLDDNTYNAVTSFGDLA